MDIQTLNQLTATNYQTASAQMQKDTSQVNSFESALKRAMEQDDDTALKDACQEFEGYFIQMMFKSMRSTVNREDGILPRSEAEEIFEDMLYEEYAKNASERGMGLAAQIYNNMKMHQNAL